MQKKDWVFQVCMVRLLILHFLGTFHSTAKLLTPPVGSISQRISEWIPSTESISPHKHLAEGEMQLWELQRIREQEPSRILCWYQKEKMQMVPQTPPVLVTISYILGKSQQIWRKKEPQPCSRAAAGIPCTGETTSSFPVLCLCQCWSTRVNTQGTFYCNHKIKQETKPTKTRMNQMSVCIWTSSLGPTAPGLCPSVATSKVQPSCSRTCRGNTDY